MSSPEETFKEIKVSRRFFIALLTLTGVITETIIRSGQGLEAPLLKPGEQKPSGDIKAIEEKEPIKITPEQLLQTRLSGIFPPDLLTMRKSVEVFSSAGYSGQEQVGLEVDDFIPETALSDFPEQPVQMQARGAKMIAQKEIVQTPDGKRKAAYVIAEKEGPACIEYLHISPSPGYLVIEIDGRKHFHTFESLQERFGDVFVKMTDEIHKPIIISLPITARRSLKVSFIPTDDLKIEKRKLIFFNAVVSTWSSRTQLPVTLESPQYQELVQSASRQLREAPLPSPIEIRKAIATNTSVRCTEKKAQINDTGKYEVKLEETETLAGLQLKLESIEDLKLLESARMRIHYRDGEEIEIPLLAYLGIFKNLDGYRITQSNAIYNGVAWDLTTPQRNLLIYSNTLLLGADRIEITGEDLGKLNPAHLFVTEGAKSGYKVVPYYNRYSLSRGDIILLPPHAGGGSLFTNVSFDHSQIADRTYFLDTIKRSYFLEYGCRFVRFLETQDGIVLYTNNGRFSGFEDQFSAYYEYQGTIFGNVLASRGTTTDQVMQHITTSGVSAGVRTAVFMPGVGQELDSPLNDQLEVETCSFGFIPLEERSFQQSRLATELERWRQGGQGKELLSRKNRASIAKNLHSVPCLSFEDHLLRYALFQVTQERRIGPRRLIQEALLLDKAARFYSLYRNLIEDFPKANHYLAGKIVYHLVFDGEIEYPFRGYQGARTVRAVAALLYKHDKRMLKTLQEYVEKKIYNQAEERGTSTPTKYEIKRLMSRTFRSFRKGDFDDGYRTLLASMIYLSNPTSSVDYYRIADFTSRLIELEKKYSHRLFEERNFAIAAEMIANPARVIDQANRIEEGLISPEAVRAILQKLYFVHEVLAQLLDGKAERTRVIETISRVTTECKAIVRTGETAQRDETPYDARKLEELLTDLKFLGILYQRVALRESLHSLNPLMLQLSDLSKAGGAEKYIQEARQEATKITSGKRAYFILKE